jgi:hypothetical protein
MDLDGGWAGNGELRIMRAAEGQLSKRDSERVNRWIDSAWDRAAHPDPRTPAEVPAWERARRRAADVERVVETLRKAAA